jgi:hypothetical protein
MQLEFKTWLSEAVTEFPGNLRVPAKLLADITSWYLNIFLKVILQSTIENLNAARLDLKKTQKVSQFDAPVDMEEIELNVSQELRGSGASKEEYDDLKNSYIELEKNRYRRDYSFAAKKYNELLDLQKYLKNELGVKRDLDLDETLHFAAYDGKKFDININDFSDIIKKLERSGKKINYDYIGDHLYCVLSNGIRARNLDYNGIFDKMSNSIDIPISKAYAVNSIHNLFLFINDMKAIIRHELIHALQWNIYDKLKITKDNDELLPDFATRLKPDDKLKYYFSSKSEHPSQLVSAVADFKSQVIRNSLIDKDFKLTNDMIRFYTDQIDAIPNSEAYFKKHELFTAMKKYEPEHYRRTVLNFIKLLNKEPLIQKRMSYGSSGFTPLVDIKSLISKKD